MCYNPVLFRRAVTNLIDGVPSILIVRASRNELLMSEEVDQTPPTAARIKVARVRDLTIQPVKI